MCEAGVSKYKSEYPIYYGQPYAFSLWAFLFSRNFFFIMYLTLPHQKLD